MLSIGYKEILEAQARNWSPPDAEPDSSGLSARYVAYGVIAPIIVCVGMVGNLLTIFLLRLPQFRGVTYTYFLMLAMSDFVSLSFCISFLHHILTEGTCLYSTAVWYSYFEQLCVNIPMSTSVLIIICVTVDRYFSICRPTDFKRIHTRRYAWAGIIGSFLVAVAVWLPSSVLKKPTLYDDCETSSFVAPDNGTWWVACMVTDIRNNPYYIAYAWIRQTLISFLPIVILILLNTLIIREFIRLRQKKEEMCAGGGTRHEEQHLVTMLSAIMISFFVTMVPAGFFNAIYTEVLTSKLQFETFRAVANILEIVNHALNFYIYILCSKPIREAIAKLFLRVSESADVRVADEIAVQQEDTGNSARAPNASTPSAIHRTEREAITQREKSKTVSRETASSDAPSYQDSSLENFKSEVSCSANDKHRKKRALDMAPESLQLKFNTVDRIGGVEFKSAENGLGHGVPEMENDPMWESSSHSGREMLSLAPAQTLSSEKDVKGNCNEAFTFEE